MQEGFKNVKKKMSKSTYYRSYTGVVCDFTGAGT